MSLLTDSLMQPYDEMARRNSSVHSRIIQNFVLIWLKTTNEVSTDDCPTTINQLRRIVNTTIIFNDVDECIDFLTELQYEKAFIILPNDLGQQIVPKIHDISQLDTIYVISKVKLMDKHWTKDWLKVKGVFTETASICESLRQAARQCDQDSISISIISPDDAARKTFDELDQSYMYTQLFKEILLEIPYSEQSIKELSDYCRNFHDFDLNMIDEFEREYHNHSPIWWYTYAYFIYTMLNRALRTVEVGTIIKMGFFAHSLHRHIEQIHSEQSDNRELQSFTIYRGQGITNNEFEKIKKSQGGLLAFNNFLSTSTDRQVSFLFADTARYNPDLTGILFEMIIDRSISPTPFALLDNISYYQDSEHEVLFSMHTVFRIGEIKCIHGENRLWQVELRLTSDSDQQLKTLTEQIRVETFEGLPGWHRLSQLLIKLGKFDKVKRSMQYAV